MVWVGDDSKYVFKGPCDLRKGQTGQRLAMSFERAVMFRHLGLLVPTSVLLEQEDNPSLVWVRSEALFTRRTSDWKFMPYLDAEKKKELPKGTSDDSAAGIKRAEKRRVAETATQGLRILVRESTGVKRAVDLSSADMRLVASDTLFQVAVRYVLDPAVGVSRAAQRVLACLCLLFIRIARLLLFRTREFGTFWLWMAAIWSRARQAGDVSPSTASTLRRIATSPRTSWRTTGSRCFRTRGASTPNTARLSRRLSLRGRSATG